MITERGSAATSSVVENHTLTNRDANRSAGIAIFLSWLSGRVNSWSAIATEVVDSGLRRTD